MSITESLDPETTPGDPPARIVGRRLGPWIALLALPLIALALLAAEPDLDQKWEHYPSHFWLVLTVAAVNVALGLVASEAAARRDDARTFFVSMALLASAGFLGLHALATPRILVDHMTAGFSVAARVGLLLAAGFAAISALDPDTRVVRVLARHHRQVRTGLGLVLAAWAVAALARVPLLDRPLPPDAAPRPLGFVALLGVALYGFAAVRYAQLYRDEPRGSRRAGAIGPRAQPRRRAVPPLCGPTAGGQPAAAAGAGAAGRGGARGERAVRRSRRLHRLLGRAARERGGRDAEPLLGGGRARGRHRGRLHRAVRRRRHHRRLQRGDRAVRPRPAGRPSGPGGQLGSRAPGRRPCRLAAVPDRGEHRTGGRRQRRRRPPAQLHVIGDTINLAARLQTQARPGEVVIGPTTRETLADRARVVPLGDAELKGKPEPVPVYRLVSVTG